MTNLTLYRKRIIPDECVLLKDDIILSCDEEHIITSWQALHPKKDLHHGSSCYFLKEGFKVSKFCRESGDLLYWYCDIVEFHYHPDDNSLIVTDLLADVIIYPDGFVRVVDLDELAEAMEHGLITKEQMISCLRSLDHLLTLIYRDKFDRLQSRLNSLGL